VAYFQKLAIYFAISHFSVLLAIFFACKQESSLVNLPTDTQKCVQHLKLVEK